MLNYLYDSLGIVGILLILTGFVACYLAVYCFCYTLLSRIQFKMIFHEIHQGTFINRIKSGTGESLLKSGGIFSTTFISVTARLIEKRSFSIDCIRRETGFVYSIKSRILVCNLTCLKVIAVISPLCGLLGTVLGMMHVFEALSSVTSVNTRLLTSGLSEALTTTLLGLSIAIPALVFYYMINLWQKSICTAMLESISRIIDEISADPVMLQKTLTVLKKKKKKKQ